MIKLITPLFTLITFMFCPQLCANSVLPAVALTKVSKIQQTGTFSNLKIHSSTGDLLGCEIRIIYSAEGYKALVHLAQGSAGIARLANVEFDKNRIAIALTDHPYGLLKVNGTIAANWIDVELIFDQGGKESFRLPRKKSYWD